MQKWKKIALPQAEWNAVPRHLGFLPNSNTSSLRKPGRPAQLPSPHVSPVKCVLESATLARFMGDRGVGTEPGEGQQYTKGQTSNVGTHWNLV